MAVSSLPKPLIGALENLFGGSGRSGEGLSDFRTVGGGCINHAGVLTLEDGRRYFLKWNAAPLPHMFEREAEGLLALHRAGTIRVPQPIATRAALFSGEEISASADTTLFADAPPFLVMGNIETGSPSHGFHEEFGARFAELHRITSDGAISNGAVPGVNSRLRFGFDHDNFLGSTRQPNKWDTNWVEFFGEQRLGFQFRLARENGAGSDRLQKLGRRLLERLGDWLSEPDEPPCLLHGDLWSGNYLASASGDPVLIDPAAYYGRREADLAMTMLFGGFSRSFYSAYEEVWPLKEGSEERLEIYELYHLLNHLNLFGGSYEAGCLSILDRLVG